MPEMRAVLMILAMTAAAGGASAADTPLTPAQAEGEALFRATCVYCHAANGWATRAIGQRLGAEKAEIAKRDDLSAAYVRLVVRRGFRSMPAYTPTDLSSQQLDAVADYLTRHTR